MQYVIISLIEAACLLLVLIVGLSTGKRNWLEEYLEVINYTPVMFTWKHKNLGDGLYFVNYIALLQY